VPITDVAIARKIENDTLNKLNKDTLNDIQINDNKINIPGCWTK
jgi:hypothetical protein